MSCGQCVREAGACLSNPSASSPWPVPGEVAETAAAHDQEQGVGLSVPPQEEGVPAGPGGPAAGRAGRQPAAAQGERCPPAAARGPAGRGWPTLPLERGGNTGPGPHSPLVSSSAEQRAQAGVWEQEGCLHHGLPSLHRLQLRACEVSPSTRPCSSEWSPASQLPGCLLGPGSVHKRLRPPQP